MSNIAVRYIVNDVEEAIAFYTHLLDFTVKMHPAPGFAALIRDKLTLYLNAPGAGGGGQATDENNPKPGGWNRFQLEVKDLEAVIEQLKEQSAQFRGEMVTGKGGKQILLEDPSGNLVELFEPFAGD